LPLPPAANSIATMATRQAMASGLGLLIGFGLASAALNMGLRQSFGLFLTPMTAALDWTPAGFAFAIALQVLVNGIAQPVCGQLADRYGARAVLQGGAVLYGLGILGMALSPALPAFTFFAGIVMGVAVSAAGMPVVVAALTRLLPEERRARAAALGTAGSSLGQSLVVPLVQAGIAAFGWQGALLAMAASCLMMIPLAIPLDDRAAAARAAAGGPQASARDALAAALRSPTFWCLSAGFFVCGVHVSFLSIHLPGFVASCHLPAAVGAGAISLIGLFNIAGALGAGELAQRWKRRELLVMIYAARAVTMAVFVLTPPSVASVLVFSAVMGLLWLSTVPPTVALVARNFGVRWLGTVFGLVFLFHQVGGFVGGFLGGVVFARTGSYELMWWIAILLGVFAAAINLPVREPPPLARPALT
jgi:MFS family permease